MLKVQMCFSLGVEDILLHFSSCSTPVCTGPSFEPAQNVLSTHHFNNSLPGGLESLGLDEAVGDLELPADHNRVACLQLSVD